LADRQSFHDFLIIHFQDRAGTMVPGQAVFSLNLFIHHTQAWHHVCRDKASAVPGMPLPGCRKRFAYSGLHFWSQVDNQIPEIPLVGF
jgi:hypothetical protein